MHILYIHQHFATPEGSTGTRSYEFARRWIKAGHKVSLITGFYDLGGLTLGKGLIQRQIIEGINVVAVVAKYGQNQSFLVRVASFLCFCLLSVYAGLRIRGVDVIYATSTPLTVGIPAMVLKWLKRIPFVFEVRDQWPEAPIEMGIIKSRALIKILLWLEKTIYGQSTAIVALSPGQADGVREIVGNEREIIVIPNSCDTEMFRPDIDGSAVRRQRDWGDKLVFLHAGAMGRVNGLDFIIDVADRLRNIREILFVLLGQGNQELDLRKRIKGLSLTNVEILPAVPKQRLPEFFAAANLSLVIIADYPILEHNCANKFFDSLSAGKPILLNYSGWQRKVLEEANAGFGCKQCDIDEFVEKLLYFASHREILPGMGRNARRIAVEKYDRDKLAQQALEVILSV